MEPLQSTPGRRAAGGRAGPELAGLLYGAACAVSFGLITTSARLAYDAGSNPFTVILARFAAATVVTLLLIRALRRPMRVGRAHGGAILALGLAMLGITVGYLTAVWFIPVSLGALVFYTYPLMVAAMAPVILGTRLTVLQAGAFVLAFLGLALALGPSLDGLDWRGVALAFGGAVAVAVFYLISGPVLKAVDTFVLTFYINAVCLAGTVAAAIVLGGLALPATGLGWLAFAAAAGCYVFAVVTQFAAIRLGGPSRTAMVLNLEPVVSIAAAVVVLAEPLSVVQVAGIGLVFAGLVLFSKPTTRGHNI